MNETLTSPGVITYSYDKAGNMISQNSGGTVTTYTYDYRNRLTGVEQAGVFIATYTYNALNQRIGIDDSGAGRPGLSTTARIPTPSHTPTSTARAR